MSAGRTTATFYIVFDAEIGTVRDASIQEWRRGVRKVRAVSMKKTPPALKAGQLGLRFDTTLPESAFLELMPTVEVEVPDGHWTSQPIRVEVEAPPESSE